MTFNTGNNVPSTDPRDLYDNAENLDKLVNGGDPFYADRKGVLRESWAGMENSFTNAQEGRETAFTLSQADKESRFQAFLVSSGYVSKGDYAAGVVLEERNEYVAVDAATTGTTAGLYRPNAEAVLPLTLTGTWATDAANLVLLGDDVLRQELASSVGAAMIGAAAQVVPSISDLRGLLRTSPSKSAFVTGYYAPGDGGGGAYYLDLADGVSADNGGTVIVAADGARWKLSQAGVVSVKQFGAKGDGVTDDTAAVQSACDAAGLLFVPAGTYLLSSRITVSDRPFMLYGGGKEVSVLLWSGIAGGFAFSDATGRESATRSPCTLRDLSIVTSQAGGGTALEFDYSADAPGSVYGDATTVTLNNVDIRGDDFYEVGATSYWTVNLHLIDAGGVSVDNARILGMQNGPSTTTGILIEGQQGYSIRYLLSKLHVQWVFWALKIVVPAAYTVEGVYLSQFEFVGVGYGVHVSGGMLHACEITTGHIDAENGCVVYEQNCYGSTALKLASCYLQLGNKRTGAYSSGAHISLPGVNHSTITGNYFLAAPAGSGVTHDGVLLKSTDYSVVDCNDFQNQNGAAIGFVTDGVHSDCVGSYAGLGNTFQGVTTELVNSNTITSAMLKRPKNFSSAWAPGTIAANSSATTLISLGGVLPGDPVQVSHTGMVASSCLISSYVTAPGQIEVIIFNNSGSPQAIGAGNAVGTVGGVV